MTRLDRIIQAFNKYDEMVRDLAWNNNDGSKECELNELQLEVSLLIGELKRYGCRRKN